MFKLLKAVLYSAAAACGGMFFIISVWVIADLFGVY